MRNSKIQWTDDTWNPIRGCSRVSEGCRHCYAELVAARFSGPGQAYEGLARRRSNGEPQWTGVVRLIEDHLYDPLRWKRPRRVFVNSMSDLFHEALDWEIIAKIFAVMALAPQHQFQVLTKRPERMARLTNDPAFRQSVNAHVIDIAYPGSSPFRNRAAHAAELIDEGDWPLRNVWLGTSVEDQSVAERITHLLNAKAAIRFVSAEPLIGPLSLEQWALAQNWPPPYVQPAPLHWVIVGGESGPGARPCNLRWIYKLKQECFHGGVKLFIKQLGAKPHLSTCAVPDCTHPDCDHGALRLRHCKGDDMTEWPRDLRVREYPR